MCEIKTAEGCSELLLNAQSLDAAKQQEYIRFLQYCMERLNKGDTVQAIWSDYQASKSA